MTRGDLSQADRALDAAAHVISLGSPVAEAVRAHQRGKKSEPEALNLEALKVGQTVYLARLGVNAEILEISRKGQLKVRAGAVTLQTTLAEVAPEQPGAGGNKSSKPSPTTHKQKKKKTSDEAITVRTTPMRLTRNTLDLRGERVDAALDRVDAFVDELLRLSEPAGYVLHGHGTGALKQAVREHVRSLRHVRDSGPAAPEDGGDAFTLVWLAD
ncbi:MAG: Smr/MutS family protein [Polyangiaceae bacterium]